MIINESRKMKEYNFKCSKFGHKFKDEYDEVLPQDCNAAVMCPKCKKGVAHIDEAIDDDDAAMKDVGKSIKKIINESLELTESITISELDELIKLAIKGDKLSIKSLSRFGYKVTKIVNPLKSSEVGTYVVSKGNKSVSYSNVYGSTAMSSPAKYLNESLDEAISEEVNKNDWVVVNITPRLNDRVSLVPVQVQSVNKYRIVGWAWSEALREYSSGAIVYKAKNEKDALKFITNNEKKYVKDLVNETNESLDEAMAPKGKKVFLLLSVDGESGMSEDDIDNGIFKFYAKDKEEAKDLKEEWCRRNGYNKRSFYVSEDKPYYTAYKKLKTVDITTAR